MRVALIGLAGWLVALAAFGQEDDPNKADRARLQGKWKVVSVMLDGKALKAGYSQTIDGNKILYGGGFYGAFTLDAKATPKAFDIDNHDASGRVREGEKGYKGIYAFDGDDTLKWCITQKVSDPRPKAFESKPGDGNRLLILERVKK